MAQASAGATTAAGLMVSLHCENDGAAANDYLHQLMLIRQDGRLLIYDSDQPSGQNLWPATSARLARYLKGDYDRQYFVIQGQVTPKAPGAAPS